MVLSRVRLRNTSKLPASGPAQAPVLCSTERVGLVEVAGVTVSCQEVLLVPGEVEAELAAKGLGPEAVEKSQLGLDEWFKWRSGWQP